MTALEVIEAKKMRWEVMDLPCYGRIFSWVSMYYNITICCIAPFGLYSGPDIRGMIKADGDIGRWTKGIGTRIMI